MKFPLLIFSLFVAMGIKAQNAPISLIPATETTNDTMMVEVLTEDFTGILSLNLHLDYDTTVAYAISVTAGSSLGGSYNINLSQPGSIAIGWYTANAVTLPDNSSIFTIVFSKITSGNIGLTWYDDGYSCTYSDASFNTLNDLPTENFYISSNNLFLQAMPPAPAGPISGESIVCPSMQAIYSVDSIPGATGYNWLIPQHTTMVNGFNTPMITLQFDYDFTGGMLSVAGTNITGQGTPSPLFPVNIPVSPTIIQQPQNDTVTSSTPDTAIFNLVLDRPAVDYAWQEFTNGWHNLSNNETYAGTYTPQLLIINPSADMNGRRYRCLFTDECSNALETDGEATLTVTVVSNNTYQLNQGVQATVYPNPFNEYLNINLIAPAATSIRYAILSLNGLLISSDKAILIQGKNEIELSVADLVKGVYYLRIESQTGVKILKIIKVS